jgi:hypothetical protein
VDAVALHVTKAVPDAAHAFRRGRCGDRTPDRHPGRGRLGVARRRARPAAVHARGGRICSRAAPRNRHRSRRRRAGARTSHGHRLLCRRRPGRGSRAHDPDRRRIRGDATPARLGRRRAREHRRRGRGRRSRRRERGRRHHQASRSPRHPSERGGERLRRPGRTATCPCAGARAGAGGSRARSGAAGSRCRVGWAGCADPGRRSRRYAFGGHSGAGGGDDREGSERAVVPGHTTAELTAAHSRRGDSRTPDCAAGVRRTDRADARRAPSRVR